MPRKTVRADGQPATHIVNFDFGERTYQIDPERRKVYRRFVEIETSKAFEIYTIWRSSILST